MFQSTLWTVVQKAGAGDEEAIRAFVLRYRPAIVSFIRGRGFASDAEDLAQEVLLRVVASRLLELADPAKGRFRAVLRTVARRVIASHLEHEGAKKRAPGALTPLQAASAPPAPETPDPFDREWVALLLEHALARLEREHPSYHEAMRLFVFEEQSQGQIAAALGASPGNVQNRVHRGRRKLAEFIREAIREYSRSQSEFEDELRALSPYLDPGAQGE